jgi:hypothetical protein
MYRLGLRRRDVIRQRLSILVALLLLLGAMAVSGAAPANAGTVMKPFPSSKRSGVHADFWIVAGTGAVHGEIWYHSDYPLATLLSVYVLQCDGLGHNCGRIAANATQQLGAVHVETSDKPVSFGHVYKTCGSVKDTDGWSLLNVCTAPTMIG